MELFVRGGWFKEASKKMRMTTLLYKTDKTAGPEMHKAAINFVSSTSRGFFDDQYMGDFKNYNMPASSSHRHGPCM